MKNRLVFMLCLLCLIASGCSSFEHNEMPSDIMDILVEDETQTADQAIIEHETIKNVYFYDKDVVYLNADARYSDWWPPYTNENIDFKINKVKNYEKGTVYRMVVDPIGELTVERLNIYFYVTEDKIYRLWPYHHSESESISFYDDDGLLIRTLDTDAKLIENGEVVCQLEPVRSEWEQGAVGSHYAIVQEGTQISYSRVDVSSNGEPYFYEWFTWEAKKGLIEYGSGFRAERDVLELSNIIEKR